MDWMAPGVGVVKALLLWGLMFAGYYAAMVVCYRQYDKYFAKMFHADLDAPRRPKFAENRKNALLAAGSGLVLVVGCVYLTWMSIAVSNVYIFLFTVIPYMGFVVVLLMNRSYYKLEQERSVASRNHDGHVTRHRLSPPTYGDHDGNGGPCRRGYM